MALYTKQQLKNAYFANVGDPSAINDNEWFIAEVIRVQVEIDAQLLQLTTKKADIISRGTERVNQIQARIDSIEPDAKEKMKNIALAYIAQQNEDQSEIDNDGVNL